jgi:hypothetical protein
VPAQLGARCVLNGGRACAVGWCHPL